MKLFADTNIAAQAVATLRADGHDVLYSGERAVDPGDMALLAEAVDEQRVFVTKDHDIGTLVFAQGAAHTGVILLDDLGSPPRETELLRATLVDCAEALSRAHFVRVGLGGARIVRR